STISLPSIPKPPNAVVIASPPVTVARIVFAPPSFSSSAATSCLSLSMKTCAPSFFASSALSAPRAIATVLQPHFAANCTPRCPSPPMPYTATTSPGPTPEFRRELNVVTPAHTAGPALTGVTSSGISASAAACAIMYSAYPPSLEMPVTWRSTRHSPKYPRRQESQEPQCPAYQPTPTRSPTFQPFTPSPIASRTPATSCPGMRGYVMFGSKPSLVIESL